MYKKKHIVKGVVFSFIKKSANSTVIQPTLLIHAVATAILQFGCRVDNFASTSRMRDV